MTGQILVTLTEVGDSIITKRRESLGVGGDASIFDMLSLTSTWISIAFTAVIWIIHT